MDCVEQRQQTAAFVEELAGRRAAGYTCSVYSFEADRVRMQTRMLYTDLLGRYIDVSQIAFYFEILDSVKDERPELKRLLDDCNAGNVGLIVAYPPDRFTGSGMAAALMKEFGALNPPGVRGFRGQNGGKASGSAVGRESPF